MLRIRGCFRRLPAVFRLIGLFLAVGVLVEFLPLDLAIVAVSVAALHASIALGMAWHWVRGRQRRFAGRVADRTAETTPCSDPSGLQSTGRPAPDGPSAA